MKQILFSFFICASFCILSCSSIRNFNRLEQYARASREPVSAAFVVYDNGDTVKGQELNSRKWHIDGKKLNGVIVAYQDKSGYYDNFKKRLIKGRLSMFTGTIGEYRGETYFNSVSNRFYSTGSSGATVFYLRNGNGKMELLTYNVLVKAIQDCPLALNTLKSKYPRPLSKKAAESPVIDEDKFIAAIQVYNNSCP